MKIKKLIHCWILLSPFYSFGQNYKAINGVIDINKFHSTKEIELKLNGDWFFYENIFLLSDTFKDKNIEPIYIKVPKSWENVKGLKNINNGIGFGTYRLFIKREINNFDWLIINDIGSSFKVWINGKSFAESGKIGKTKSLTTPGFGLVNIKLPSDTNLFDLVIEVSNFHHFKGGIKTHIVLVKDIQYSLKHERTSLLYYFSLGVIFIIGLYHIALFFVNINDKASLNFGLFCFDIFIFLVIRLKIIFYFYPEFNWEISNKIEHISLYLSLPLFYNFFNKTFPNFFKIFFNYLAIVISLTFVTITIITDTAFFSRFLSIFHLILILYIIVVLLGLIKSLISKKLESKIIFVGFIIFMLALINDILHVQNIIDTGNYIIVGIVGFIICLAYYLTHSRGLDKKRIIQLSVDLKEINTSLERFVPADFMNLMERTNITKINLGNYVEKEMTIMFSDIRSFTTISEKLSAKESFSFINEYLQVMGPIIRKHRGFIDKYIGDGIMALFTLEPNDAVLCSMEMMNALKEFNKKNELSDKPIIEIGIGLHTGTCILGAVGEPQRMDTTVISDSVNLAARIESLTKHYKTPVIISGETYNRIDSTLRLQIRFFGTAKVKGKSIQTNLYKVFINELDNFELLDKFDSAISHFYKMNFTNAISIFTELSLTQINDGLLQLFIERSIAYEKNAPPENWLDFEVFDY